MKKTSLLGLLVLGSLSMAAPAAARPSADANVIAGQYIVAYERSAEGVGTETDARERKLGFESEFRYRHALKGFAGSLSRGQVRVLRNDPEVAYVAPDREVHASSLTQKWGWADVPTGPRRIAAATTWTVEHASGVGVAVLDSGVDLTQPELNVSHGINCITPGAPADDDEGHGTHVAGTIAAKNDAEGVTGVAPGTKIWAVKVLDSSGSGSFSTIACGLDWVAANAAAKKIKVANLSLGGVGDPVEPCATTSDPLHRAICRVTAADVLPVVAAGNNGYDFDFATAPELPAAYPEVLTVTAVSDSDGEPYGYGGSPFCAPDEADDYPATFSNFAGTAAGAAHTVAAPGVCIHSTMPTDLVPSGSGFMSGTSMAAPHMAAIAALCENHDGRSGTCAGKTPAEVISSLRGEARSYTLANPSHGFEYDPAHDPLEGVDFGYLIRAFDTEPPETTVSDGPVGTTRSRDVSFQFASNEAGPRFECTLDDPEWNEQNWTACASSHRASGLADGPHMLAVRAIDPAGNVDQSPVRYSWTVDATAPDTSIASGPAAETVSNRASFEFSATEGDASLTCKLDRGAWAACASPKRFTGLAAGPHTLSVASVDAAGNGDPSPAVHTWTVMPNVRQIKSALRGDLDAVAKHVRRAGIAKLVSRRGFTAKGMDAQLAGRFRVVVKGKAVLAKGSRSVGQAGRYALKAKLTRKGRRMLRHDRHANVILRLEFRDAFGRSTATDKTLKLRR